MKGIFGRVRPTLYFLWIVAAVRFGLEADAKPGVYDALGAVSVFYAVVLALGVHGVRAAWDDLGFKKLLAACALIAVFAFAVPNAIIYSTAQFQGWTHGRFNPVDPGTSAAAGGAPLRGPEIQDTAVKKIGVGLMVGALTTISGFGWTLAWGTLLIYVPARVRRRRSGEERPGA